jgi:hypothetical protein
MLAGRRVFVPPLLVILAGLTAGAAELTDREATELQLPPVGDYRLRVLTPQLLELTLITTQLPTGPGAGQRTNLPPVVFEVRADRQDDPVVGTGFKRRTVYAPLKPRDLRIGNWIYLALKNALPDGAVVSVTDPDSSLWNRDVVFKAEADPLRLSPAIHVNQTGYVPQFPKVAMVGYYLGTLGEMDLPAAHTFEIQSADNGQVLFHGRLELRPDVGFKSTPLPYQHVWSADFSAVTTPGRYRLVVPGLGASEVFNIDEGEAANWTRTVALGIYHQRCGTNLALPFTRFTHAVCHDQPAQVPTPAFVSVNKILNSMAWDAKTNPRHTALALTNLANALYPYVNSGTIDVTGGHHDAGDYSKYTIDSAAMIHFLIFAADAFPGVVNLDNLGLPESGDGRSDILQEAKWEADFLAKMQDADGGFYFLVYPRDRKYEDNVPPDEGDPQVVYPKNTSATAAAVAALAQASSSPAFRREFPAAAADYLAKALNGWAFLQRAIAAHGRDGAYQKLTHYGDAYMHDDELAWAATELFLATGEQQYQVELQAHFDPSDRNTRHWTWERMYQSYGCAIRSYAFAARTGRLPSSKLDHSYLARCEAEIKAWADDNTRYADQCAYGTSFADASKRILNAGWYFSSSHAFDLVTAWQLDPHPEWFRAILSNVNYELGNNPVNVSYITGLGAHPVREVVSQFFLNSRRLPPSGLLDGSLQDGFMYLNTYGRQLGTVTWPADGAKTYAYPLYDRWGESFNTKTEAVVIDQARSLGTMAFLMTQTSYTNQPWRCAPAHITGRPEVWNVDDAARLGLSVDGGLDLSRAKVVWEAAGQEPFVGPVFTYAPAKSGPCWVEAEASWPDGRRAFAVEDFNVR